MKKTIIERVDALEGQVKYTGHLLEMFAQRVIALEQANASLGKVLSALTTTLITKELVGDDEIFKQMVKSEESNDKSEIEALLKQGVIAPAEKVEEKSFVVVSQKIIGDEASYVDYRLYKLGNGGIPQDFHKDLQGRSVGEQVFSKITEDKTLEVTIKEIFSIKE